MGARRRRRKLIMPAGAFLSRLLASPTSRIGLIALILACGAFALGLWHWSTESRARAMLMAADPDTILKDPALRQSALAIGKPIYDRDCAACHMPDGRGDHRRGVPDLTDGDYLYGTGKVAEIEQITLHGIRSGDPRGWMAAYMPAYGRQRPYAAEPIPPLNPGEINSIVAYLGALHGRPADAMLAAQGKTLFKGRAGCWDCHADDGSGDAAVGAPNLLDDVWLYGDGSPETIYASIAQGHAGKSPAFAKRLSPVEARAVSAFVATLSAPKSEDN
jgi:cytochrome c oxidase cbb3-type subunit 3